MLDSSALLLVQRHPAYRMALPGKLFEYIGARRPIVAVVPPGTEMETLVEGHADARVVPAEQPELIAATVERLLAEHGAGELQAPRVPAEVTAGLERRAQARKLAGILDAVTADRPRTHAR